MAFQRAETAPDQFVEPALAPPPTEAAKGKKNGITYEKDDGQIEAAKSLNNVPWCEEYEKMISGMLYNALDPLLCNARHRAKLLQHHYNTYLPADSTFDSIAADRFKLLGDIFGSIGAGTFVEAPLYVDYGVNTRVGKNFYANYNLTILDCALVQIGDNVMIGPNTSIFTAGHETSVQSRRSAKEFARAVVIGDDCWIGGNVVILGGVTIGKGCTIGAGSVVSKDIPDMSVAVGNPCRVVRKAEP